MGGARALAVEPSLRLSSRHEGREVSTAKLGVSGGEAGACADYSVTSSGQVVGRSSPGGSSETGRRAEVPGRARKRR